ncbi:UNVERIFIED_CONTAM: hypothetical protein FKN15_007919 [Acipenser sinensis]
MVHAITRRQAKQGQDIALSPQVTATLYNEELPTDLVEMQEEDATICKMHNHVQDAEANPLTPASLLDDPELKILGSQKQSISRKTGLLVFIHEKNKSTQMDSPLELPENNVATCS